MHPATDGANFQFNLSTDAGSNYNVTKTSTAFNAFHSEAGTDPLLAYATGNDLAQSTSFQNLLNEVGNDNDQSVSGSMSLFNPASTTYVKHFISRTHHSFNLDYPFSSFIAGYGNTTSAINAVQFKMSSGNIDDGTILMYGIK
jgi:hypothetical protein